MSSDTFVFENSLLSDPFSPLFTHCSTMGLHFEMLPEDKSSYLLPENNEVDSVLLFSPSPCFKLEDFSLSHLTDSDLKAEAEECKFKFESFCSYEGDSLLPHSFDPSHETAVKFMQRSYSNSFETRPGFNSFSESYSLHNQSFESPETGFACNEMQRVCSAGDLLNVEMSAKRTKMVSSSSLSMEKLLMEEATSKMGRYSAEEKKERIDRYRAKRAIRNFNKTIKYACRKTLADNRQRIRGRFARSDEAVEIPKASINVSQI